jgi:hypothetical protein
VSLALDAQGVLSVVPLEPADPPDGLETFEVEYTMCDLRRGPSALTAIGRAPGLASNAPLHAVESDLIQDRLFVDRHDLVPVEFDDPQRALLVPLVATALAALDAAQTDLGWDCFVVGSDLMSQMLAHLGRFAGARRVVSLSPSQLDEALIAGAGPGEAVFMVSGADNGAIANLLSVVPERSTIVLLGSPPSSSDNVNFYSGIHRRSLRLLGTSVRPSPLVSARAARLVRSRLELETLDIPIVRARSGERIDVGDSDRVILEWEPAGADGQRSG